MLAQTEFDPVGGIKKAATEGAAKVGEKVVEAITKTDDKDKAAIREQADQIKDAGQKKASDILKTADKIAGSPEVNIIGSIAGEPAAGAIKRGQQIIKDAAHNPAIVGRHV